MPTRFRRTIKIFPGVRANISKGGVSFSLGKPGFTINVGKHGIRRTVGLPGSGVSNTEFIGKDDKDENDDKGKDENGITDDAGAILMGMAAANLLDGDDDNDKPKRKPAKKERTSRKRTTRARKETNGNESAEEGGAYALRGLMVLAAIGIALYLGTQVLPQLPPNWYNSLIDMIIQWAVQFGH
jgi:hypothetical protein